MATRHKLYEAIIKRELQHSVVILQLMAPRPWATILFIQNKCLWNKKIRLLLKKTENVKS